MKTIAAFRIYADAWTPLDSVAAIRAVCEQTTRLIINLWRNFTAPQVSLLPVPSCALKTIMSREKAEVDFRFRAVHCNHKVEGKSQRSPVISVLYLIHR